MDLKFTAEEETFRDEVRTWLEENLSGEFSILRGRGGPGDEDALYEERRAWEKHLGEAGWIGIGWPEEYGGKNLDLTRQVIFNEEYARAKAPGRMSHIGEHLLAPTLIAFGTDAQRQKFLPGIRAATELWCQGYSEPNAGSDLAGVQTKAVLEDGQWSITGQKIWTSLAHWSEWCFVLCRTDFEAAKHKGLSYLLVPMQQEGIEIRPIMQMTGTSEFSEVFFDNAKTDASHIVGAPGDGWKVALGTLAFERGASTLGQQLSFQNELDAIVDMAKKNGASKNPEIRKRIVDAVIGLKIMRYNALRMLTNVEKAELSREALIMKLFWATWHRDLGKLAMDVLGAASQLAEDDAELTVLQRLFLFTRSDTIYAGSNEIQKNIIAERGLQLPRVKTVLK